MDYSLIVAVIIVMAAIGSFVVLARALKVLDYMTAVYGRITSTPDISKIAFAKASKKGSKNDGN
jgi:hypothetical protein